MQGLLKPLWAILLIVNTLLAWSAEPEPWFRKADNNQIKLRLSFFLATTCPHCEKEVVYLRDLQKKKPWLEIESYPINKDMKALEHFRQILGEQNLSDYSVPSLFFCNTRWVGFDSAETSGPPLEKALDYCYQQISRLGYLDKETTGVLNQWASANLYIGYLAQKPSAMSFIPFISLLDAMTSCSFFVLLGLFSFLWLSKDKGEMLIKGGVFIALIILVHNYQQVYADSFYLTLNWLRIPTAIVGLVLLRYVFKKRTVLLLIGLTAFCLEAYQQTCLPNMVLVFKQWLNLQTLSFLQQLVYSLLYSLFYIFPLILFMSLIIYLKLAKKLKKIEGYLGRLSWCLLAVIGLLFVFFPQGIASFQIATTALIFALLVALIRLGNRS
jgi:thiol-disulfide isomerase/thioredoxin